jgi:hypothetical protein
MKASRGTAGEIALTGGRTLGAVRVADTVRKPARPWTPAVQSVLRHLEAAGFDGAPRALGVDPQGREVLTYLPGATVGETVPWPGWVYGDESLTEAASWLRRLHDATTTYEPPAGAIWLAGQQWRPGLVIGHNDAAPYNAVWRGDRLVGFVDWETAGPCSRETDLAFAALWWVPLHARHLARKVGFEAFDDRRRRLHLFLDAYGYPSDREAFAATVAARARLNASVTRQLAAGGDPTFVALLPNADDFETAAAEIESLPATFWRIGPHPTRGGDETR